MTTRSAIDRGTINRNALPVPPTDTPTLTPGQLNALVRGRCAHCGGKLALDPTTGELGPGRVWCVYGCGRAACWIADERHRTVGAQPESQHPNAVRRRERGASMTSEGVDEL